MAFPLFLKLTTMNTCTTCFMRINTILYSRKQQSFDLPWHDSGVIIKDCHRSNKISEKDEMIMN